MKVQPLDMCHRGEVNTMWFRRLCVGVVLVSCTLVFCLVGPICYAVEEGFETGFSGSWQHGGDAQWTIVSDEKNEGAHSAKSGDITHGETSSLKIQLNVRGGSISFFRKVSSEEDGDFLVFKIDGGERGRWSGEEAWLKKTYYVSVGTHTFEWVYEKDDFDDAGSDSAWIDSFTYPPPPVGICEGCNYNTDCASGNCGINPSNADDKRCIPAGAESHSCSTGEQKAGG
jgi:hypothetical protein